MIKRTLAILLTGILGASAMTMGSTNAQTKDSQTAEAAKATVARAGLGKDAKVEVTLRDKRKLKGYVSAASDDSFTLKDKKTGDSQMIAYADVFTVKKAHGGVKTSTWILIAGAAAAAVIVAIIVHPAFCDGC